MNRRNFVATASMSALALNPITRVLANHTKTRKPTYRITQLQKNTTIIGLFVPLISLTHILDSGMM
jgi:hypothetical protein